MPDNTIDAFMKKGTVARTVDVNPGEAQEVLAAVSALGIDLDDVAAVLEQEGVASFVKSFDELITSLSAKAHSLT